MLGHVVTARNTIDDGTWSEFEKQLRTYVRGRVDPAWVEDLVGNILERLVKNTRSLAAADNPAAYVQTVSRNMLADYYRRRAAEQRVLAEAEVQAEIAAGPENDGEAEIAISRCMLPFIERLPAPYRDALTLTEIERLPQREAAKRLGLSVSGLKSRVQRGRAKLKQAVTRCCEVEIDRRGGIMDFQRRAGDIGEGC